VVSLLKVTKTITTNCKKVNKSKSKTKAYIR